MTMRRFALIFSKIPVKWKLTLWSALLLFLLFAAYNAVQYMFVEKWMIKQEEMSTQQDMREILNYLLEKEFTFEETEYAQIRNYLEKVNQQNQLIRILDEDGEPIIVVSDELPNDWLESHEAVIKVKADRQFVHDNMLILRSPLTIFRFNGTVEIVKSMEDFAKLIAAFFQIMILCCLGAVVLSGLGGRLLARQLLKPLQSMNETIRNVTKNGLQERMQLNGSQDEIYTLMKMFNEMMDQVERSFNQQRQFVEDASHELRTPIAILEGHLVMLQRWGKQEPAVLAESLQVSVQELSRLKGLVQELLSLTRAEQMSLDDILHEVHPQEEILRIMKNVVLLHPSFRFEVELDRLWNVSIAVSGQHLEQLLLILLDNAVKYSGESRTVRLSGEVDNGQAVIRIFDYGIGIHEQDMPFVWDRFYRADKARGGELGGYGLGLSIAKRLSERYKGSISIQSRENAGTTVTIALPIVP